MKRLLSLVFPLCLLTVSLGSFAQDTGTGMPAFNSFSHAGGGIDTINLGNLNVHMEIPLRSLGAYGPTVNTVLTMDSLVTLGLSTLKYSSTFQVTSNVSIMPQNLFTSGSGACSKTLGARGVKDMAGTYHDTPPLSITGCNSVRSTTPGNDGWALVATTDANESPTWYGISPSGDSISSTGVRTDPHRNTAQNVGNDLKDALGNVVLSTNVINGATTTLTYPGPNSTTSTYTLNYSTETEQAAFGCSNDQPTGFITAMLTSMTFPDNSTMSFTYEPVYNNSAYVTGRIKSVRLRTGATITYDYTGYGTNGINCSDGSTAGFKKITPDGTWKFAHSAPSGTNKLNTTTVTAPTGDVETYTFSGLYPVHRSDAFTQTTICYSPNLNLATCTNPPSAPTLPITERDVYSYVTGITSPALKVFLYDSSSRLTDVKTYDFGKTGPTFATQDSFAYGTWNIGTSACNNQTEVVQGVSVSITGVLCFHVVNTPGVANIAGQLNSYNAGTADLAERQDLVGGAWRPTTINYDSFGRVIATYGPNGEYSHVSYTQCAGTMPYQYAYKASDTGPGLYNTVTDTDCAAEVPETILDLNNNPTTISYDTDPFWRPTSITDAAGTVTTLSYTATSKTSRTLVTSSSVKEFVETLDSMGRPSVQQQRTGLSSTNYNSVETDYDINGRVSRVTTPYQAALGGLNHTIVSTTSLYDAINRPTSITSPNGTVKSFTYTAGVNAGVSARDTLVALNAGPNGEQKQTQYEFNGLGRVTSVCEVTSMAGSHGCGQVTAQNGFLATYSYSGPGNLLSITQNVGGATTQPRSFTYENSNTGRMLTATTPEAGTFHLTYDTDATCGTFIGAVVKTADNGGGTTCLSYDLLGRVTAKSYSGLNSGNTSNTNYRYDSITNPNINCANGSNWLGRLAEVSTDVPGTTDEGFCYDVAGNPTDVFQSTNGDATWTHVSESYFPTGIPKTLAIATQPTITYGLDPMARVTSASASGTGQDPLTSVGYNATSLPTAVNFGSGDASHYQWLNGIGPMNSATFDVGSSSITNTLTWNPNGTLKKLVIVDPLNAADAQTCTYSYDDLSRLLTDNCGSTVWNQTLSYDPFGNVKKSGNPGGNWQPVYDQTTNHYQSIGATYDLNGRLTNDTFDNPIQWDIEGNIYTQSNVGFAYDGLGRTVDSVVGGVRTNYVYAPDGSLFATADNSGNIQKMFVPLPMSTAVYSGGTLQQYRRNDWQGSVRVASTSSQTLFSGTAYSAFGEHYAPKGNANNQFAGLTSDISSGTEQVSLSRRYHPGQGRWISPDGGIPNILNPQTFNAYHYALNSPTNSSDPGGNLEDMLNDGSGVVPDSGLVSVNGTSSSGSITDPMTTSVNIFIDAVNNALGALVSSDVWGQISDNSLSGVSNLDIAGGVSGTAVISSDTGSTSYFAGSTNINQIGNGVRTFIGDLMNPTGNCAPQCLSSVAMPTGGGESGIELAQRLGRAGESALGITGAKVGITIPGSGVTRFPDQLTPTILTESKNVAYQAFTRQLRDYSAYASQQGLQFNLYVRQNTILSGPLQNAVKSGDIKLFPFFQ